MAKTPLEKMFLKPNHSATFLHVPNNVRDQIKTSNKIDNDIKGKYDFILAFYTQKKELQQEINKIKHSLETNGILWIGYPKGKALETDLNRDILHSLLRENNLDGVSIISLNDIWSVMRFKLLN
ncbi:MAG TPA: hypothetical protein VLF93_07355 [Candidatus Saccharimonadales bacterium]|nr:hypothetical protein [Candidatus Saccharimonadales bacterium]